MHAELGLLNIWAQGDGVSRAVTLLLLTMSLASWLVILLKSWALWQIKRHALEVETFWHSASLQDGLAHMDTGSYNPFRELARQALEASRHVQAHAARSELAQQMNFSDWVTRTLQRAIDDSTAQLQSGLAVLASVGSTAPFVGLFGTVWGIYHALMQIGAAGQATIDQVAGPIGEALIMTALGLAVAIPAVLGYNALVRGNKFVLARLHRFAHDLHALQVTGARVASQ